MSVNTHLEIGRHYMLHERKRDATYQKQTCIRVDHVGVARTGWLSIARVRVELKMMYHH